MRTNVVYLVFLMVLAEHVFGHHAGAAQYRPASTIEIEGKVTRVFWQNPHVHFLVDVKDAAGDVQEWDVESNSVSILRRMGIARDVVRPGNLVKIAGWPSRPSLPQMFATNMLLGDGKEVLLSPGNSPRWSTKVLGTREAWTSDGVSSGSEVGRRGIFQVWSTNISDPHSFPLFRDISSPPEYALTESAQAKREAWNPIENNPYLTCTPMGMPRVMGQPYPIEFVDRGDRIGLRIELHDLEREIVMSNAANPTTIAMDPLGYSVGRWETETLVVETTHVSWPFFDQSGVPLSDEAVIVERFRPTKDASRLEYQLTVTDPATFTMPIKLEKHWNRRPNELIQRFDCTEFTPEVPVE